MEESKTKAGYAVKRELSGRPYSCIMTSNSFDLSTIVPLGTLMIALAMSGGIDSAVAAWLLRRRGLTVHGFFMKHPYQAEDETDARRLADFLEIPLEVIDVSDPFEDVVENFTEEYFAARTPNPCVFCNRTIKFGVLLDKALARSGAERFATGHYARTAVQDGFPALLRGVDPAKDQSYVLYGIDRNRLAKLRFPLGELTKAEVRRLAAEAALPLPDKKESQDICFVPDGCHSEFLHARRPGVNTAGRFVSPDGRCLALHGGFEQFTIGQRKGMGVGFGQRVFVHRLDPVTNDVVIGPWEDLAVRRITVTEPRWLLPENPERPFSCQVKVRYRCREAEGRVSPRGETALVEFTEPLYGVAPGQSAVFYENERVLGGGLIAETR